MRLRKSHHDVTGWKIKCSNYHPCPLCYGCRSADFSKVKCVNRCAIDEKFDICNVKLHTEKNLNQMIAREKIVINNQ